MSTTLAPEPIVRNMSDLLSQSALSHPDKTFLTFEGRAFTYREADQLASRHANGFLDLGVGRGDHVAVMMDNCPEYLWCMFGLARIGAVMVTINTAAKGALLAHFLEAGHSRSMVVDASHLPRVREVLASVDVDQLIVRGTISHSPGGSVKVTDLETFSAQSDVCRADAHAAEDTPCTIIFTSGTTGPSKPVLSPHSQPVAVGTQMRELYGIEPDDILFTCLPLFHANALWYTCVTALVAHAQIALSAKFSASTFWDEICDSGATIFNFIGTMANIMLKREHQPAEEKHRVRWALIAPSPRELIEAFDERYGIGISSSFAATEHFLTTSWRPDSPESKRGSAGKVNPGTILKIVDSNGDEVPPNTPGEILIGSSDPGTMFIEYFDMAEETKKALAGGLFHTGDRGYLDEDGYLFFMDKVKDSIRRRGENISAHEVEILSIGFPGVQEVAAIPVPAEMGEDEVMLFVVPSDPDNPPDRAELVRWCNDQMAYFMVPRFIEFIDVLPKTPNHRIEKYRLKDWAGEHRHELWDREQHGIELTR